ncbi:MAG: GNAT family N-acetyltransferase [Clostridiales bacterium]|nr:GNAT family N-acetyltransferase [Clostridiales bacterium]
MNHTGSKILHTERLTLRPFRETDAEDMFTRWASDPNVTKYVTWTPHENVEMTRALLRLWEEEAKDARTYHWAIEFENRLIGDIALLAVDDWSESATVGYCMAKEAWGKGIMTEAFGEVLRYAFEEVGFMRIAGEHAIQNPASGRVMEKCGLKYEGTRRGRFRLPSTGEWTDIVMYGITKQDYFQNK